jgi:hypothetical protein
MCDVRFSQPCHCSFYSQVEASDTLTSVAARFDTTPSELTKLNRLATRLIFPGQVLYVPNKQGAGATGSDGRGTSADDGEGAVVSTPAVTQQLEGNTDLLDEKGENLIVMMGWTFKWILTLFIVLFLVQMLRRICHLVT